MTAIQKIEFPISLYKGGPEIIRSISFTDNSEEMKQVVPDLSELVKDLNDAHPEMYRGDVVLTGFSILGYILPYFVNFPLAKSIQIVALGVLTAAGYGIVNDLLACRQCIEYFTNGHTSIHKRLLKTDDPTANGIVWGIYSTAKLGAVAGIGLALAARATKYNPITANQLTPYTSALAALTCISAHIKSKEVEEYLHQDQYQEKFKIYFNDLIGPSGKHHPVDLRKVPDDKRAAWFGVGVRNEISYRIMGGGSLLLIVGVVAARFFKRSV